MLSSKYHKYLKNPYKEPLLLSVEPVGERIHVGQRGSGVVSRGKRCISLYVYTARARI